MKSFKRGQPVIVQLRKGGFEYVGKYDSCDPDSMLHFVTFPLVSFSTGRLIQDSIGFSDSQLRKEK
jgi:hypothetical protein